MGIDSFEIAGQSRFDLELNFMHFILKLQQIQLPSQEDNFTFHGIAYGNSMKSETKLKGRNIKRMHLADFDIITVKAYIL